MLNDSGYEALIHTVSPNNLPIKTGNTLLVAAPLSIATLPATNLKSPGTTDVPLS
jgi:hypothetical protein